MSSHPEQTTLTFEPREAEWRPLKEFAEKAYLDYSMYVILDRALPHIGDGLKPVQRRIIYAMSELGLGGGAKFKKSARTIGDVLGKFHPHGESACYEAMVLLAQPFASRYPLIDGQGNWGSADDPKSFAAMRYTEARLTEFAAVLLQELRDGTVDWTSNFDGTLDEPVLLPARLPHVLLNGAAGIAVGMATDVPPHNVREVVAACLRLLDEPEVSVTDLCRDIRGPDFPTDAEIVTPPEELVALYERGAGSVRMRARFKREAGAIVVTALPYQVSGSKILEQIAQQMLAKKLPVVEDLRDESDHEHPMRLVIVPKSERFDVDRLMSHLFATTDLERTYRVNMTVIGLDHRPKSLNLKQILVEWLAYRTATVRRRLEHRLARVNERLHLLGGLLAAFLNLDEVIAIIREEEHPKPALMRRFELTDLQADAILNLRLRNLAKLEEMEIRAEQSALSDERDALEKTLASKQRVTQCVKQELLEDAKRYGDDRRSPIVKREAAQALDEMDLAAAEPITVVLSERGWVRAAKGHEIDPRGLSYRSGDGYRAMARGLSNQPAVFLDSTGRAYCVPSHTLASARGQGAPLSGHVNPSDGATFEGVMIGTADQLYVVATDAGYGYIVRLEDLRSRNRAGKACLSLAPGARVLVPRPISDPATEQLAAVTSTGRLLIHLVAELPRLAKGKGVKIIGIPPAKARTREEYVVDIELVPAGGVLTIYAGKRHLRLRSTDLEPYALGRGRRGKVLPRGFQRVDRLEANRV